MEINPLLNFYIVGDDAVLEAIVSSRGYIRIYWEKHEYIVSCFIDNKYSTLKGGLSLYEALKIANEWYARRER